MKFFSNIMGQSWTSAVSYVALSNSTTILVPSFSTSQTWRETPLFIMENWNPYTSWISLSSCLNTRCLDHLPLISSSFFLDISFISLFSFTSFDPTGSSFQFLSYSWSYASEIICSWKHIHTEVLIPEWHFYCYHRDISVSYLVREVNHGSWIFISFYIWLFHF